MTVTLPLKEFRFVYQFPVCTETIYIATLEDFRLVVERELSGYNADWYLQSRYGVDFAASAFIMQESQKSPNLPSNMIDQCYDLVRRDIFLLREERDKHAQSVPVRENQSAQMADWQLQQLQIWLRKHVDFHHQLQTLKWCRTRLESLLKMPQVSSADVDNTLYVYKGRIICERDKHPIVQATGILKDLAGNDIQLNVEHCPRCGKFFIHYDVYKLYRERYGIILGDMRMLTGTTFTWDTTIMAEESALHLCGYNVAQREHLTSVERQSIIVYTISRGNMNKGEVVRLLRHLIGLNESKPTHRQAVIKWQEDLEFTLQYRQNEQAHYQLEAVRSYGKNRFVIKSKARSIVGNSFGRGNASIGKRVRHRDERYGIGTVEALSDKYLTIAFDNGKKADFSIGVIDKGIVYEVAVPAGHSKTDASSKAAIIAQKKDVSVVHKQEMIVDRKKEEAKGQTAERVRTEPCRYGRYTSAVLELVCTNRESPRYSHRCKKCSCYEAGVQGEAVVAAKPDPKRAPLPIQSVPQKPLAVKTSENIKPKEPAKPVIEEPKKPIVQPAPVVEPKPVPKKTPRVADSKVKADPKSDCVFLQGVTCSFTQKPCDKATQHCLFYKKGWG